MINKIQVTESTAKRIHRRWLQGRLEKLAGNQPRFIIIKDWCEAVIFDLDGVITITARVHAAARKELFDQPKN
jgi:hypothetical protein